MAKKKVTIKCISGEVKDYLLSLIKDNNTREFIEAIPECDKDNPIEFDLRKGRKVSEYSKFIGGCIKEVKGQETIPVSEAMKKCAVKWKSLKIR